MAKRLNEKGITLVELLAALALFGIISVLIWNFFFHALNFNEREVTKNQLQQEANLIVNTIQQLHTKSKITSITNANDTLTVNYDVNKHEDFHKKNILYILEPSTIIPSKEFKFKLTLESLTNDSVKFQVETTFSKLK
ncbi:prepilin-type N-terminal cleavage/methylation domain-containing protein [Psychrobacillus soli]|uniref:Prepilin-type N-terminal cleavage/methylation domain-containing protein n=1 Tax=Psychrobacillus soli TaxID=1543965 RepID=A0A544TBL2_9BACI|nr:prepilin-type N-terminal cleavage/methylation domain-containing protein [Psychrobacillus soli]TQR14841.1 prepilin-type N-terminal cleavage/methylation domain-containing protein [Psychrobacillus soli]